ncbi:MAG: hypothetical protein LYZ69_07000 [Nitrososphaerales archaeon]|nr:hypothetical protein [Nitrososphaerales archaeon]
MAKKKSTSTAEARKSSAQTLLKELGRTVYSDLDAGRFPSLTLASRSVGNIVYDKKLQQFVLGSAQVKRSSANIKHIRPFTQLIWLAYFAKKLVEEKRTSTLRDVYYSAQAFNVEFVDQAESDELITDLEVLMQMAREGLNIYPEERSSIFGNMTIEYTVPGYEGKKADLSANPDGVMIGPALTTAEFADTDAEMVLAIEKGGLFTRFVEERVHRKYKAILINTAGQPPRSTRYLLRRLNQELKLPVGILCDADPWGAHIAMVIKSGSVRRDEPVVVRDAGGRIQVTPIGEFVDECLGTYGSMNDENGNEVTFAVPYEALTLDDRNKVVFRPISSVIRHRHVGRMYQLTSDSGRSVWVTPNHSVFVLREGRIVSAPTSEIRVGDLLAISRRSSIDRKPTVMFDVARELLEQPDSGQLGLYLIRKGVSSPHHRRRRLDESFFSKSPHLGQSPDGSYIMSRSRAGTRRNPCPAIIWLTKDFARLLGYYTAEGWIGYAGGRPHSVNLCFNLEEVDVVEDAKKCFSSVFPGCHVSLSADEEGHSVTLTLSSVPIAALFAKLCGAGFANKRVPEQILSVKEVYALEYLRGCFGDGYVINSGTLCWKMKNPLLIAQLSYLLGLMGVMTSISKDGFSLLVSGRTEVEKVQSVILHQKDMVFIAQHLTSGGSSSYLMPKAFPAVASRLMEIRQEIGRHNYHDLRSRYTYRRLCEVRAKGTEGGINRARVIQTLEHLLACSSRRTPEEVVSKAKAVLKLVESDVAFDPVAQIEQSEEVDEYVYDFSIPGEERFIGGRSGIVLHNSANAAHLRELTTPKAVWLGVWASDIVKYKLPSDKLTDVDIKRLYELKADPRYTEKMWHDELDTFLKIKKKSEQEAFARYGLSYIVDKYLPEKLELMKSA